MFSKYYIYGQNKYFLPSLNEPLISFPITHNYIPSGPYEFQHSDYCKNLICLSVSHHSCANLLSTTFQPPGNLQVTFSQPLHSSTLHILPALICNDTQVNTFLQTEESTLNHFVSVTAKDIYMLMELRI